MSLHAKYLSNLEAAKEFEDFASDILREWDLSIHVYRSAKRQILDGETRGGVEIKLDRKWKDTGNLFIECEERPNTNIGYYQAGICGPCWLYVIGSEERFWLLAVSMLLNARDTFPYRTNSQDTAKGFLLRTTSADKWAIRIYDGKSQEKTP